VTRIVTPETRRLTVR